jgi:hypothetical protein
LLVDQERYAHAPRSPLGRYADEHPERVRKVWGNPNERASVVLYEVNPLR